MHPRPTARGTAGVPCSSAVREATESREQGASAFPGSGTGGFSSVPAGRGEGEEGGDEGAFGVAAGGKLSGSKIGMNARNSSALLPDPAHLPHYKLVKLL